MYTAAPPVASFEPGAVFVRVENKFRDMKRSYIMLALDRRNHNIGILSCLYPATSSNQPRTSMI